MPWGDFMTEKIIIASDHAGYELRQKVIKHLQEKGFEVLDGGAPNGTDSYSYVDAGVKLMAKLFEL